MESITGGSRETYYSYFINDCYDLSYKWHVLNCRWLHMTASASQPTTEPSGERALQTETSVLSKSNAKH